MGKLKQKFTTPLLQLYDINKNFVCNLTNRTLKNSAYSIKKKIGYGGKEVIDLPQSIEIKISDAFPKTRAKIKLFYVDCRQDRF